MRARLRGGLAPPSERPGNVPGPLPDADALFCANRSKIAQALRRATLRAIITSREYHDDGVLMTYGSNSQEVGRKLAGYVDGILKGARRADPPVEEISKYELVIDLRLRASSVSRRQRICCCVPTR